MKKIIVLMSICFFSVKNNAMLSLTLLKKQGGEKAYIIICKEAPSSDPNRVLSSMYDSFFEVPKKNGAIIESTPVTLPRTLKEQQKLGFLIIEQKTVLSTENGQIVVSPDTDKIIQDFVREVNPSSQKDSNEISWCSIL